MRATATVLAARRGTVCGEVGRVPGFPSTQHPHPLPGFPLTAGRPLYSELVDITLYTTPKHRHVLSPRSRGSTFRPPGAPVLPDPLSCSLAERHTTAAVVVSLVVGVAFSVAALRLRQLLLAPPVPRAATARVGSPRARAAALGRVASPLRGSDRLSLVDESRSHPRSLYRPRLASPLRRLLVELGEAWPPRRKSRWSSCRRDGSTPGELVCPDPTRRGRDSPTLTPSDS